jgi:hypothetical protein
LEEVVPLSEGSVSCGGGIGDDTIREHESLKDKMTSCCSERKDTVLPPTLSPWQALEISPSGLPNEGKEGFNFFRVASTDQLESVPDIKPWDCLGYR